MPKLARNPVNSPDFATACQPFRGHRATAWRLVGSHGASLCALAALLTAGCEGETKASAASTQAPLSSPEQLTALAREALSEQAAEREARELEARFPAHGAVTSVEIRVHSQPDPDSSVVGWLRVGAQVRLAKEKPGRGCPSGWYPVHPTGYVCKADGLHVSESAPTLEHPSQEGWKNGQVEQAQATGALVLPPAARDAPLPYDYYFVKEATVPSYHRLPSRNEQRAALAKATRYRELLEKDPRRAQTYLRGERDDGPAGTEVTARYLDRGFFVAANGTEVRARRRFVRTNQGRYIKEAQLEPRLGHDFRGVELRDGTSLPLAWLIRDARPLSAVTDSDGDVNFDSDQGESPLARQTLLRDWKGMERVESRVMHVLHTPEGPRYLRSWFASVAHRIPRPAEVPPGLPWVHVDTDQQTAVLYQGDDPVFATLISTGVKDHETPVGVFEIRRKRVTDTMADLGPDAGDDRYRVEDVPWTQYFEGSFALHAAFWHTRFGIRRSHGCVNLSPTDAHRMFRGTLPEVPAGWHGLSTEDTQYRGSWVVVTDEPLGLVTLDGSPEADAPSEQEEGATPPQDDQTTAEDEIGNATDTGPLADPVPRVYGIGASARSLKPWSRRLPEEVTYTVQRGGSARFVANLYGLYHHEIQALNPEINLDEELPPGTALTVYRYDAGQPSRSVGSAFKGELQGGAPLPDGPGRELKATPNRTWATRRTAALMDSVLEAWPRVEPGAHPLLVGNLSARRGGKLPPHASHQSGRDVDLGYPQAEPVALPHNWRDMDANNLEPRRTWRLLHLLQATGELEVVYIDRALQKVLYDFAKQRQLLDQATLREWLQYPRRAGAGSPRVQHVPGHVDHLHVRFRCGQEDPCRK